MPRSLPPRRRRVGLALGAVVVLVLLLLSHDFGRAVPTNNYRPLITTDAIESGCYPLPGDVRLEGLSYQVRWDEDLVTDTGERRRLRGQYNLVERAEAERLLRAAFADAGFVEVAPAAGESSDQLVMRNEDEEIAITVTELPDTSAETLVRGEFVLDLPVAELASDDPICESPSSTKRWAEAR